MAPFHHWSNNSRHRQVPTKCQHYVPVFTKVFSPIFEVNMLDEKTCFTFNFKTQWYSCTQFNCSSIPESGSMNFYFDVIYLGYKTFFFYQEMGFTCLLFWVHVVLKLIKNEIKQNVILMISSTRKPITY